MLMIKKIAAAAALLAAAPAFAAIQGLNAQHLDGELYFNVFDQVANVSYTKDLGTMASLFKINGDGNEAGYKISFNLTGDANWTSFVALTKPANLVWNVLGNVVSGGNKPGFVKLYTTVKGGDEAVIPTWTNQLFSAGVSTGTVGWFLGNVNDTGTHGVRGTAPNYATNGSSVNKLADDANSYFGTSVGERFNGRAPFSNSNAVGESSTFSLITRSSLSNNLALVNVDTFANSHGEGKWVFESTTNGMVLTYALAVPEPSSYALLLAGLMGVGFVVRRRNQA
ncbi:PEP-CTERM sorting domain-containing protein [Paucibacter sp. KCTC 42545]|uniref:PEP-CTERM sorting domain-containing protein n=1 Tax=Paucibacter sp. KCTC 42545 TaxID=1768242 RepID=UPI000733BDB8|nr:PEP-CTERM sorting domain-containing protein [Paucibacter sp. KCTC 42545]ALT76244.1 hypothetical protein AT984_02500 [Paucibacter sp. KCTC 42545]